MTIKINTDTDRDEIADKIGARVSRETLRTGSSRQRRLEQSSQRRTRVWDLDLRIDPSHQTAHCDQNGETPEIVVSGREFDQPVTDMEPRDWDYMVQRALTWHEDGHVLFTDHDDFRSRLRNLNTGDKGTAKQLWNALEDGAIETELANDWRNAYDLLRTLRLNLFDGNEVGIQDVENGGRVFPLAHATQAVLMDEWMNDVYDIHRNIKPKLADPDDAEYHFATDDDREIFMDEILPLVEAVVPDVLSIPNSVKRNQRIFEFIEEVMPLISDGKADGKSQMNRNEGQTPDGMPDDASEGHSGSAQADAQSLGDIDPEDIEKVVIGDVDDDAQPTDVEIPEDVEIEISEDVNQQTREEAGVSEDLLEELEEMKQSISDGPDSLSTDEILIPSEDWDGDDRIYQQARTASTVISQVLRNRLQQERSSKVKRNQRRGRFTGRGGAVQRAARGQRDVKERVSDPEDKDYHFAFVLDRSGSMRGSMSKAEEALGMLALALEEVGVEVMIIEMYSNEARLAKPFGSAVEQHKDQIFHGHVSGSTPLTPSVELARERLNREGDNKALVVVTDGQPDNSNQFEKAIKNCSMPTLGVNLTRSDQPAGMDDYDRAVAAEPSSDLQSTLKQLVQEVMF